MVYYHPSMVNANQTADERNQKYWHCRSMGLNSYEAARMRDWRWDFINWFIDRWILKVTPKETKSHIRTRLSKEAKTARQLAEQAKLV